MVEPTLSTPPNSQAIKELQPKTTTLSVSPIATQPLNYFMKPTRLSLLMPFLTLLLALFSSTLKSGEWETLFDGHSTDAFRAYQKDLFPSQAWNVIDGTLRTNPKATPVDLITKKTYQSFELVFDWIATQGANSGVIYRVSEEGSQPWHTGLEYQILDSAHAGNQDEGAPHSVADLYDLIHAKGVSLNPAGKINQSRIVLSGNHVEHWLNGQKVVACALDSFGVDQLIAKSKFADHDRFAKNKKGHIVFQHHQDEVWFKKIQIRALPEPEVLPTNRKVNTLNKAWREAGWVNLFNGKNTMRWRGFKKDAFPSKGWIIENDCLKHISKGGGGDIITKTKFGQFDFQWEWKVAPGANSGVKYFIMEERGGAIGHEYQVIDDSKHPDALRGPKWQTAAFYDVFPASNRVLQPVGSFNQSRILVQGQKVEHWLNGIMVLHYTLGSERVLEAVAGSKFKNVKDFGYRHMGHVLLQDHQDEVHYRNLRIKRLRQAKK